MLKELTNKVVGGFDLSGEEAYKVLNYFLEEEVTEAQIATLLTALRMKGETVDELTGFAMALRDKATIIEHNGRSVFDCCGTGGDMSSTINVSTASGILASACGVSIAKHSNRSITSNSGSSDVLGALSIPLCATKDDVINSLTKNNIAFLHAPSFHTATKRVAKIRQEIGIRTIFNFLGPLTNPFQLDGQLVGVSNPSYITILAEVLRNIAVKKVLVVCAENPRLDEISVSGVTKVCELNENKLKQYEVCPEDFGLKTVPIEKIKGSTPQGNAEIIKAIFAGKITDSRKDIVVLNTAAVLYIAGVAENILKGIQIADDTILKGLAENKLQALQTHKPR